MANRQKCPRAVLRELHSLLTILPPSMCWTRSAVLASPPALTPAKRGLSFVGLGFTLRWWIAPGRADARLMPALECGLRRLLAVWKPVPASPPKPRFPPLDSPLPGLPPQKESPKGGTSSIGSDAKPRPPVCSSSGRAAHSPEGCMWLRVHRRAEHVE